jgi:hypothetical protein
MTTQQAKVPDTWRGSNAAYVAFEALMRAGKEPGRDFSYQPRTQGRRMESGVEVDFSFSNPPDLAMQVQESFYSHHSGVETRGTDVLAKAQLAGLGITLIMLEYDKLIQDPDWVVGEALQYRDHSWG